MTNTGVLTGLLYTLIFTKICSAKGSNPGAAMGVIYMVPTLMGITLLIAFFAILWIKRESLGQFFSGIRDRGNPYGRDRDHLLPKEETQDDTRQSHEYRYGATT